MNMGQVEHMCLRCTSAHWQAGRVPDAVRIAALEDGVTGFVDIVVVDTSAAVDIAATVAAVAEIADSEMREGMQDRLSASH